MREILFRGKRTDNGEWAYGSFVEANRSWHNHGIHKEWIVISAFANGGWFNVSGRFAVDGKTVGQYTGLTDKNGKKIFEGDIVRRLDVIQVERETGKVGFDEVCCCFCLTVNNGLGRRGIFREAEYEVIGNIYDNPELLEGAT